MHPRSVKQARLTPEVRALLGTEAETPTPPEPVRALLSLALHLLYLGCRGTFAAATYQGARGVSDPATRAHARPIPNVRAHVTSRGRADWGEDGTVLGRESGG